MVFPEEKGEGVRLAGSPGTHRLLAHAGLALALAQQAHSRTTALWGSMAGKQVVGKPVVVNLYNNALLRDV